MARTPKPKTMAADGVLDDAAPLPEAAPVAGVTPAPLPEAAPDGATQPADAMGAIVPPPDLTAFEAAFAAFVPASVDPVVAPLPEAAPVLPAASADTQPNPAPVVCVRALQPQRWRIGRAFGVEPVEIPAADLTEAEAEALMADPLLSVTLIDPA